MVEVALFDMVAALLLFYFAVVIVVSVHLPSKMFVIFLTVATKLTKPI